jgi:hypothetical protein
MKWHETPIQLLDSNLFLIKKQSISFVKCKKQKTIKLYFDEIINY